MAIFVLDETGLWIEKHPAAILPYSLDFSVWLKTATLVSANFTVPDGITKVSQGVDTTAKTGWVRLSGGTPGKSYKVVCHVVSGAADEEDFAFTVKVVNP